jgi:hypothetical protein
MGKGNRERHSCEEGIRERKVELEEVKGNYKP